MAQLTCRVPAWPDAWVPIPIWQVLRHSQGHVVPMLTFHLKDVYLGCTAVQVPTSEVIARPLLWMQLVEEHKVTHSWAPNFGFKLVARAVEKSGAPLAYDVSCLKKLMNAFVSGPEGRPGRNTAGNGLI